MVSCNVISLRRWPLTLACLLTLAPVLNAADEFLASLPAERVAAIGIARLDDAKRTALESLVQRDLRLAREGGVNAFARTFTTRRTDEERTASGIDLLTSEERDRLDAAVATALLNQAAIPPAPVYREKKDDEVVTETKRPIEVHGEVWLSYGVGKGGYQSYGGGFTTTMYDPAKNLSVSLSVAQMRTEWDNDERCFGNDGFPRRR